MNNTPQSDSLSRNRQLRLRMNAAENAFRIGYNQLRQQNKALPNLRYTAGRNGLNIRCNGVNNRYTAEVQFNGTNISFVGFYRNHQEIWTPPFDQVLEYPTRDQAYQYIINGFNILANNNNV